MKRQFDLPLRMLTVLLLPLLMVGCEPNESIRETTQPVQDTDLNFPPKPGQVSTNTSHAALTLSPSSATVGAVGDTVVFVANGGTKPYTWGVGQETIGSIRIENGNPCIYKAKQLKKNSVYVRDARGSVAAAAVNVSL